MNNSITLSKEQLTKLKASYDANAEDLVKLETRCEGFPGLESSSESFEQGYNNALEFVFRTIGVNISDLTETPAPQDGISLKDAAKVTQPCGYCFNAKVDPSLCDDNDLHYHTIGEMEKGFRMMLTAGARKPCHIIVDQWNDKRKQWELIGYYYPDHCPKCGRELTEYRKDRGSHNG